MATDEFIAHSKGKSAHLKEIGWELYFGTTSSGNLGQYKVNSNPCGVDIGSLNPQLVDDLDINPGSFRFYHVNCIYAVESEIHQYTDRSPLSPTFGQTVTLSGSELDYHTVTSGIMIRYVRGSKHGWLCVDDNCPYYLNTGMRYFYF
jgi:hypothetical protein